MSSKKKIIISLSALALVIVAAVVAVVAVLAAQSVTVQSSLSITYEATDIYGAASIDYKYEGATNWTNKLAETTAVFNGGANEDQTVTDWALNGFSKTVDEVVIRFGFKKESSTVEDYTAACTYSITGADSGKVTVTSGTAENSITTAAVANMFSETIDSTDMEYFYVKIALNSVKVDITELSCSFNWSLSN